MKKGMHRWTIEWRTIDGVRMISRRWAASPEAALADLRTEWVIGSVECIFRGKNRPKKTAA